jgi:hypothetical protein
LETESELIGRLAIAEYFREFRKAKFRQRKVEDMQDAMLAGTWSHRASPGSTPVASTVQLSTEQRLQVRQEDARFRSRGYNDLPLSQRLKEPITIKSYGDFEEVLSKISVRSKIKVEYQFADLAKEGISRIGHVDFPLQTRSIADTLSELLRQHNPHPVTGANDPDMVFVFVVSPDEECLVLTTRENAERRGRLPELFLADAE